MGRKTPGIYIAIRGDYSAFETDLNAAKKLAKAQGDAIAKSINNAVSAVDLTGGINKLTRELKTAQAALSAGAFKGQVSGLEEIAKAAGVSSKQLEGLTNSMLKSQAAATANRAFEYLQKNAGLSTLQLAKLRAELGDTSGALSTLWSGAKSAAIPILAVGAAALYAGKACFDASLQMDRLVKSYATIEGSTSGAVSQLDYIYEISNKLGLEFQSTAEAAKGFFAAGKGSALQKDLNGIFEGVSQVGAALSLSTEQMDGVFLALGQMISKGKVQAEELRGQLGERLPGAFNLAARAMGVTTAQLDDMLKKGQVTAEDMLPKLAAVLKDEFGPAAEQAAQGAQGAVNRLSTEWNLFKATVMDNKGIIAAINAITDAMGKANAAQREQELEKRMEAAGWEKATTMPMWGVPFGETVKKYTEEQKEIFREYEKVVLADAQKMKSVQEEENKILAEGEARTADFLKNTTESKIAALNKDYDETVLALTKKMILYQQQGQDFSGLQKELLKVDAEYDRQLEALNKKGAKSAEAAANRAAKALAAYDEEIAKLMQSSRELEQVKIEEKLAKIAKDAKLPTAEMEKLRKAMEQEADFKWMQDILSYADPAAAAVAKVDKEYEAFLRNVEYLKKTDPAKYTQLMTKAETEHEKALRKAERASKEQNEHLQEKLSFYKELEEMSGAFGLSLEVQNRLLDEQMEIFRDADIPENLIQTWRQYKDLMNSHDWADGAQRAFLQYRADATDAAKGAEEAFSSLYSGMDSGWKSAWEQMIETGKVSLSSFRSLFASFLADLMHMAITRPITVQIAVAVSGMLGTGGVAYAAGGSGGSGGGITDILSMGTSFLPGGSVTGMINEAAAWAAPSLFSTTSGYMEAAGTELLKAGVTGTAPAATPAPGTFTSAFGAPALGSSIGSFASPYVNNLLGLQNNKGSQIGSMVGGLGSTAVLGTMAATNFWNPAGWIAGGLAALSSILGGSIGSLFGGGRKTHASVYGKMEDVGFSRDQQTYIDAFMGGAWYDRAGATEAQPFAQAIGEAASQTAGTILDLAAALPDEYRKSVEDQLASATWDAGRGISGASWNFQWWEEGMAEERTTEAVKDMFEQMGYAANKAFAEAGIGDLFDSFDLSTEEGFKKAQTAISAISSITTAIDEITSPATEAEKQAQAFVEQMNALGEAVKASGLNAAYADEMIGEYRTAYVDKYVETLEEMFNPLSQIEQQAKGYKTAIDGYVAALTTMGASEAQLAQVRGYTQDAINNITGSLDAAFFPLSEVETRTKATMESLLAYKSALETLGASTEELTRIDAAWGKMQSDLLDKARDYVRTTPQIVSQSAAMNAEFDALREAMLLAGNATADLTELERTRAQAVAAMQAQYAESFRQTYAQRYATLTGDTNGLAVLQQQASFSSELAEIEKTWGKDSLQYKQMQALQEAEAAKLRLEQAQADADRLAQLRLEREKLVMQTSVDSSKARLDALKAEKSAAEKLKSTWEDVLATIYKTRLNMYQSDDNLDLFGRLATAQGEFDRLYGLAIGGDAEAAKEMASVSSGLLDLRKETSATSAEYLDAFYGVDKKLKDVSGIASKQVSAADRQLAALGSQLSVQEAQYGVLSAQLSALGSQNATLASIDAQIAGLKGVLSGLDSAKGDYQSALDKVNEIKPNTGVYGSNYLTEYDLMAAKVASLNRGEYIDPNFGIPAGGWTIANARQAMLDTYGSVPEWYKNAGKIEGFAKGGLASGWGIAGEYGPELIDFSTPGRVYTAEQTRQILMPPAVGTDGSLVAEIAKLREQNKEMARELRIANARLEKMEKYAKETKDGVDEIRVVGIPVTVEA